MKKILFGLVTVCSLILFYSCTPTSLEDESHISSNDYQYDDDDQRDDTPPDIH